MDYYSAIKKKEIMSFAATWMDLEIILLSEVNQRQISYHLCAEFLKNTNELIYKTDKLMDIENKFMVIKGDSRGGEGERIIAL